MESLSIYFLNANIRSVTFLLGDKRKWGLEIENINEDGFAWFSEIDRLVTYFPGAAPHSLCFSSISKR